MFRTALSLPGARGGGLLSLTDNAKEGETFKSSRFLPRLPFHCVTLNTGLHLSRPRFAPSEDEWREQLSGSAHAGNASPVSGNENVTNERSHLPGQARPRASQRTVTW